MTTNNPPSVPGEIIRRLRNFKGIKQEDAGKNMDISQQAYSKIELSEEVPEKKVAEILVALSSNQQELENIINLLPPPPDK